jgi:hypothetical protein
MENDVTLPKRNWSNKRPSDRDSPDRSHKCAKVDSDAVRDPVGPQANLVYITAGCNDVVWSCLLDSGCDVSVVPTRMVNHLPLSTTSQTLTAANGTTIEVKGQVQMELLIGCALIPTTALVSDHVVEPMLGIDWLRHNDCQ